MVNIKKNTGSYLETRKIQRDERKVFESITPVPSALGRIKSQKLLQSPESHMKKYKKGYLTYQTGGHEYWQKIA